MDTVVKTGKCRFCDQVVYLIAFGLHYKWVTNALDSSSWHCGSDPNFPLKAHENATA
jgi:hypothetical protein